MVGQVPPVALRASLFACRLASASTHALLCRRTRAATLLLVHIAEVRARLDRLPVVDLGPADVAVDLVLAPHALDIDIKVQLPHATDDGFTRLCKKRQTAVAVDRRHRWADSPARHGSMTACLLC